MKIEVLSISTEPVTPDEVKTNLRLDLDDTDHDSMIEGLISAAREMCETEVMVAIPYQTIRASFDGFPCGPLRLPKPPLQSVTSIEYKTADGWQSLDSYTVLSGVPGYVLPVYGSSFPKALCEPQSVRVTYTAGVTDPKQSTKQAITLLASLMYDDPYGCSEVPNGVRWLLNGERWGVYV